MGVEQRECSGSGCGSRLIRNCVAVQYYRMKIQNAERLIYSYESCTEESDEKIPEP